jgi:hypothetical protein
MYVKYFHRLPPVKLRQNAICVPFVQNDRQPIMPQIPELDDFTLDLTSRGYIKHSVGTEYKWDDQPTYNNHKITCKNKAEHIKGRESTYYCNIDTYESIHESKFIMLKNQTCYDIELLMKHIICTYKSKSPQSDPGNADPDKNEPIWSNMTDIKRFLAHPLIRNPDILDGSADQWTYSKEEFVTNCKKFRSAVIKTKLTDAKYTELFDKHLELLLNINRLAIIFHTDQPSNYFDPEKIKFENLDHLCPDKIDIITNKIIRVLNLKYSKKLQHIDDPDKLKHEVVDIFTSDDERLYYEEITQNQNLEHSFDDTIKILVNVSYMYGLSKNFKDSIKAKSDFMTYLLTFTEPEQKLINKLLKPVMRSNECIHLLGNRLKKIFIKHWFLLLSGKGISKNDIATKHVPRVYSKSLNASMTIKSPLLNRNADSEMGYYFAVYKKTPVWVNKMGHHGTWDGVSLLDFSKVHHTSRRM